MPLLIISLALVRRHDTSWLYWSNLKRISKCIWNLCLFFWHILILTHMMRRVDLIIIIICVIELVISNLIPSLVWQCTFHGECSFAGERADGMSVAIPYRGMLLYRLDKLHGIRDLVGAMTRVDYSISALLLLDELFVILEPFSCGIDGTTLNRCT